MTHGNYRAHTNIALIKYWGKRNDKLFLPMTSSLSLTLDAFYTETLVMTDPDLNEDQIFINNRLQNLTAKQPIVRFIDLFRDLADTNDKVFVQSTNHVPTAAGLASSASAYAALACSLNDAYRLNLDPKTLSTLARQGSGSASRSLFGGFVQWHKGHGDDSDSSYAEMIDPADWGIAMLVIIINDQEKKISSRQGMNDTVKTSPFYKLWPQEVENDLDEIRQAIAAKDFDWMGQIAEHNAMKMHATTIAAKPSFTYWSPESVLAFQYVQYLRDEIGFSAYVTMDAGPNVKVLVPDDQVEALRQQLLTLFEPDQLIIARPGPGPIKLPLD